MAGSICSLSQHLTRETKNWVLSHLNRLFRPTISVYGQVLNPWKINRRPKLVYIPTPIEQMLHGTVKTQKPGRYTSIICRGVVPLPSILLPVSWSINLTMMLPPTRVLTFVGSTILVGEKMSASFRVENTPGIFYQAQGRLLHKVCTYFQ